MPLPSVSNLEPARASVARVVRNVLNALVTDLSGGENLCQLTYRLVLQNLVKNIEATTVHSVLKVLIPLIILAGGLVSFLGSVQKFGKAASSYAKATSSFLTAPFTSQITLPSNHPINDHVLAWLAAENKGSNARSLVVLDEDEGNSTTEYYYDYNGYRTEEKVQKEEKRESPLSYIPDVGKHRFRYGRNFMTLERRRPVVREKPQAIQSADSTPVQNTPPDHGDIILTCFPTFRGIRPLQEFLEHVRCFDDVSKGKTTTIYRPIDDSARNPRIRASDPPGWKAAASRAKRPIESIALEESTKKFLVGDLSRYVTPQCETFY